MSIVTLIEFIVVVVWSGVGVLALQLIWSQFGYTYTCYKNMIGSSLIIEWLVLAILLVTSSYFFVLTKATLGNMLNFDMFIKSLVMIFVFTIFRRYQKGRTYADSALQ